MIDICKLSKIISCPLFMLGGVIFSVTAMANSANSSVPSEITPGGKHQLQSGSSVKADSPKASVRYDHGLVNFIGTVNTSVVPTVESFKGIRYATAQRWQPPQDYSYVGSDQPVDATKFGAICPQNNADSPMSEDCLFLNIYRPAGTSAKDHLPVFLFIHGGAFVIGSGSSPLYSGDHLISQDTTKGQKFILVTINYRLGILGFKKDNDQSSGNYGIMDQSKAMEWVHQHIQSFGGDPKDVTLFGESAGAMSVGIHLTHPNESGKWFQKAIMESNPYGIPYKSSALAEQINTRSNKKIEKICGDKYRCSIDDLLKVQAKASKSGIFSLPISSSFGHLSGLLAFSPYIDGDVLKGQPINQKFNVPVLLGYNHDEGDLFVNAFKNYTNILDYNLILKFIFGKQGAKIITTIPQFNILYPDKQRAYGKLLAASDYALFNCANRYVAKNQDANTVKLYQFNYVPSFRIWPESFNKSVSNVCATKTCHASELPFVFNNQTNALGQPVSFNEADQKIANSLSYYNFSPNLFANKSPYQTYDNDTVNVINYNKNTESAEIIPVSNFDSRVNDNVCEAINPLYSNQQQIDI